MSAGEAGPNPELSGLVRRHAHLRLSFEDVGPPASLGDPPKASALHSVALELSLIAR